MADQTLGATVPIRTTRTPFTKINLAGELLFEVREGVNALAALEMASCYMAAAQGAADEFASSFDGENPDRFWAVFYLVQASKAVLDATIATLAAKGVGHD